MVSVPKLLGAGNLPASQAAVTVVDGVNTVPTLKIWVGVLTLYNTGTSTRVVTIGFTNSGSALVIGEYLMLSESMVDNERREFPFIVPAAYVLRGGQVSGTDIQWMVTGYEVDV